MNVRLEAMLDATMRYSPAQPLFRRRSTRKLAVLAYHSIDDPGRFAAHLDALRRIARPVTQDEVLDAIAGRRTLPNHAVLITFDDADATVLDVAMPLLQERGMPALAFVVAGVLDTNRPLWPGEVRDLVRAEGRSSETDGLGPDDAVTALKGLRDEQRVGAIEQLRKSAGRQAGAVRQLRSGDLSVLEAAGIAIGNHTMTHPCLDRCGDGRIAEEIGTAHRILTQATGRAPRALAYPNGNVDDRVRREAAAAGYEAGFLFDHALGVVPPRDRFAIPRLRINSTDSVDRFRTIVSGFHPAVHALRSRRGGSGMNARPLEAPYAGAETVR